MEGGNYDTAPVLYTGKKSQSLNTFLSTAQRDKVRLISEKYVRMFKYSKIAEK